MTSGSITQRAGLRVLGWRAMWPLVALVIGCGPAASTGSGGGASSVAPSTAATGTTARTSSEHATLLRRAEGDWSQWRGPARDGVALVSLPEELPARLRRVWQVEVGVGHSSPLVAGELVFLHSREREDEVMRALRLVDGSTVWRTGYAVPYRMNPAAMAHGKGPKSTPVLAEGRLYTLGISGILSAFDTASGELLWQKTFAGQFRGTYPIYGAAMSPMVEEGLLVAHVGGARDGALVALDAESGETRWSLEGDGPGYASPILAELDGTRQLITQTDMHIVGVSFDAGELLWRIPFRTDFDQNVVTPVFHGNRLILSGLDQGVFAVELLHDGGRWTPVEVWRNETISMYMSAPVVAGGRLFGMSHKRRGQFFALDPGSGELIWTSTGREGENAALVVAGDRILVLTDGAELIVLPVEADAYQPLARYTVADSPTWAHPVPSEQGILIKDLSTLALWSF